MTNFEQLSDKEKMDKIWHYALMKCQAFLHNPANEIPELDDYKRELRAIVDFIVEVNPDTYEGMRLY